MRRDPEPRKRPGALGWAWVLLVAFAILLLTVSLLGSRPQHSYNGFLDDLAAGRIARARIDTEHQTLTVVPKRGETYQTGIPDNAEQRLVRELRGHHVEVDVTGKGGSSFTTLLLYLLVIVAVVALLMRFARRSGMGGSGVGGILQMRRSQARRLGPDQPRITFADVAGVEEAVEELAEIKDFLAEPRRFQALGAQIPKGVLLLGPPGTGKTLLARAVAGEAGVPFFSGSGSDFVEMFVGVGASRVRDLFQQAKQQAPCIVFVDEIDAVGRQRGAGMGGGNDEREQTLNQILVELDGFQPTDNVIVVAATNRPDVLDPALLRPGRFDRHITVDRPDRAGREQILKVHTRGKPLDGSIDLAALAGQTPGLTGADLANIVNEAALLAARGRRAQIGQSDLEEATLRVIAGPERRTRVMSEQERLVTAYHEMGHAIVGHVLEHADPVRKVSIVARGRALGFTMSMPTEDSYLTTERQLADGMAMALGGRAAEELVFGEVTSGAADDLERVTKTAKQMVMRFGMSARLAPRTFGPDESQPFLGRAPAGGETDYSERVGRIIDAEIAQVVEHAHVVARGVLESRRDQLDRAARLLMERETVEGAELANLLDGSREHAAFERPDERAVADQWARERRAPRWWDEPIGRPRLALLRPDRRPSGRALARFIGSFVSRIQPGSARRASLSQASATGRWPRTRHVP